MAMLLRKELHTGFIAAETMSGIRGVKVDRTAGILIIVLLAGSRIVDRGDELELRAKQPSPDDIEALVEHIRRHRWSRVELEGTAEFRAAMTSALLSAGIVVDGQEPPGADGQEPPGVAMRKSEAALRADQA